MGWQSVLSLQKPLSVTLHPARPHTVTPSPGPPPGGSSSGTQVRPTQEPCISKPGPAPWPQLALGPMEQCLAPESRCCHLRSKQNPALFPGERAEAGWRWGWGGACGGQGPHRGTCGSLHVPVGLGFFQTKIALELSVNRFPFFSICKRDKHQGPTYIAQGTLLSVL